MWRTSWRTKRMRMEELVEGQHSCHDRHDSCHDQFSSRRLASRCTPIRKPSGQRSLYSCPNQRKYRGPADQLSRTLTEPGEVLTTLESRLKTVGVGSVARFSIRFLATSPNDPNQPHNPCFTYSLTRKKTSTYLTLSLNLPGRPELCL